MSQKATAILQWSGEGGTTYNRMQPIWASFKRNLTAQVMDSDRNRAGPTPAALFVSSWPWAVGGLAKHVLQALHILPCDPNWRKGISNQNHKNTKIAFMLTRLKIEHQWHTGHSLAAMSAACRSVFLFLSFFFPSLYVGFDHWPQNCQVLFCFVWKEELLHWVFRRLLSWRRGRPFHMEHPCGPYTSYTLSKPSFFCSRSWGEGYLIHQWILFFCACQRL